MTYIQKRKLRKCPLCNRMHKQKTKACYTCNQSCKKVYFELFGDSTKKLPLHKLVLVKEKYPEKNVFQYARENKEEFEIKTNKKQ